MGKASYGVSFNGSQKSSAAAFGLLSFPKNYTAPKKLTHALSYFHSEEITQNRPDTDDRDEDPDFLPARADRRGDDIGGNKDFETQKKMSAKMLPDRFTFCNRVFFRRRKL